MSSLLLNFPKKPLQLSDDLESFIHVLYWLTIRFQVHWPHPANAWSIVDAYEEARRTDDGYDVGSWQKLSNMQQGTPGFHLALVKSKPLASLIRKLSQLCKAHHASLNWERDLKPYTSKDLAESLAVLYGGSSGNSEDDDDSDEEVERAEGETGGEDCDNNHETISKPTMDTHKDITDLFSNALNASLAGWRSSRGKKLPRDILRVLRPKTGTLTTTGGSGSVLKRGLPEEDPERRK